MFFKEQIKKRIKNEKGLTLIELLAVIVILAIIAAIAIPAIGNIINNSRDKAQISDAINIISGAKIAHAENDCGNADDGCKFEDLVGDYLDGMDVADAVFENATVKLTTTGWQIESAEWAFSADDSDYAVTGTQTEKALKDKLDSK